MTKNNKTISLIKSQKSDVKQEIAEKQIIDEYIKNLSVIVLVQGILSDGKPCYAYALIPQNKYSDFKHAEMAGKYDLADYGEILHHGEGLFPSDATKQMMTDKYGADYMFEDNFLNMAKDINTTD
jgi:hypothetical protein